MQGGDLPSKTVPSLTLPHSCRIEGKERWCPIVPQRHGCTRESFAEVKCLTFVRETIWLSCSDSYTLEDLWNGQSSSLVRPVPSAKPIPPRSFALWALAVGSTCGCQLALCRLRVALEKCVPARKACLQPIANGQALGSSVFYCEEEYTEQVPDLHD